MTTYFPFPDEGSELHYRETQALHILSNTASLRTWGKDNPFQSTADKGHLETKAGCAVLFARQSSPLDPAKEMQIENETFAVYKLPSFWQINYLSERSLLCHTKLLLATKDTMCKSACTASGMRLILSGHEALPFSMWDPLGGFFLYISHPSVIYLQLLCYTCKLVIPC